MLLEELHAPLVISLLKKLLDKGEKVFCTATVGYDKPTRARIQNVAMYGPNTLQSGDIELLVKLPPNETGYAEKDIWGVEVSQLEDAKLKRIGDEWELQIEGY